MPLLLSPVAARFHAPLLLPTAAAAAAHPSRFRPLGGGPCGGRGRAAAVVTEKSLGEGKGSDGGERYDAIVVGSGIGGLVAATQLAAKGARVLVLEKYVIPGGSSGYYRRDGFTFDVGSSVMFGFSDKTGSLHWGCFASREKPDFRVGGHVNGGNFRGQVTIAQLDDDGYTQVRG